MTLHLALYQPDIPQNVGAAIRLCACLGMSLDVIEPCSFPWKDSEFRRTALDYRELADLTKHSSWQSFCSLTASRRKVLLTTKAAIPLYDFQFQPDDILLMGRESAGVPEAVHAEVDARILIPMQGRARSLNIVNAAAIACGEALRQVKYAKEGLQGLISS